jgi:hypoxanthine phosphoribosyltransferase
VADTEHERLTWEMYHDAAGQLAGTIKASGFRPDLLLGIARGGMFLATSLAYELDSKALYLVNVEYYEGVDQRLETPVILPPEPNLRDLASKKVLLIDDVADTGHTLKAVADLCAAEVAEVRITTLYSKPRSVVQPDWAWRETEAWIDFPWSS